MRAAVKHVESRLFVVCGFVEVVFTTAVVVWAREDTRQTAEPVIE